MTELAVSTFLASLPKDETVFYRANPGNAGDALIASGAFKLFDQAGLNVELIDIDNFDAHNKTVIYAGGGNLVGIYPEARDFFLKHHKQAKQLILLPHTVQKNEDLLAQLGSNVTLFAREYVSYAHLKSQAKNASVYLDHDLAFNLNSTEILDQPLICLPVAFIKKLTYKALSSEKSFTIPQLNIMLRNSLFELRTVTLQNAEAGNFFRDDVEASGTELPAGNSDLSKLYEYGTRNRELTTYTKNILIKYINKFASVRTDRLHICIAAALLNKKVDFYPNSYFKCKAVYEYSLKNRFPNITWRSTEKQG